MMKDAYVKIAFFSFLFIVLAGFVIHFFCLTPSFSCGYKIANNHIDFSFNIYSYYPMTINLLVLEENFPVEIKKIFIYYDKNYTGPEKRTAWGLFDHLYSELQIRNYQGNIKMIATQELKSILIKKLVSSQENSLSEAIVLNTMAFPEIFQELGIFIKEWVNKGGILFWIVGKSKFEAQNLTSVFWTKQLILPFYKDCVASKNSFWSKALDLHYPFIFNGLDISMVNFLKGKVLGKIKYRTTSVASIPLGKGYAIMFGGSMPLSSKDIAKDIAQLVISNAFCSNIKQCKTYKIRRFKKESFHEEINYKFFKLNQNLIIYIYQIGEQATFFKKIQILIED